MKDITMSIPGGWYGNEPDESGRGNVAVDVIRVYDAIRWLRKKRISIVATDAAPYGDKAVFITYILPTK